jgi:hypothetical protein
MRPAVFFQLAGLGEKVSANLIEKIYMGLELRIEKILCPRTDERIGGFGEEEALRGA